MKTFLNKIKEFLFCMLRGKCEFSIKKFLSYVFTLLAIYLAVFTTKDDMFLQTLIFLAGLLAIRSYDKLKYNNKENEV